MAETAWHWKGKDGSRSGLLYEPGNWGDLIKVYWLTALLEWKDGKTAKGIDYFDSFAGQAEYPLGPHTLFRWRQAELRELAFVEEPFLARGAWPSSASAARHLVRGEVAVFDADPGRLASWRQEGFRCLSGESGWELLRRREPDPNAVWLIDPYDFLAEWREWLPVILDKAATTSVMLYIYNRSAGKREAFADYRLFRNRLDDGRGELPKRFGRVAADAFLPRAHHEMLFLPGAADAAEADFDRLLAELERRACHLAGALANAAAFGD